MLPIAKQDPLYVYKEGEKSRLVARVDLQGFLEDGWQTEEVASPKTEAAARKGKPDVEPK